MIRIFQIILLLASILFLDSCAEKVKDDTKQIAMSTASVNETPTKPKKAISEEFKKYWYTGKAEITSYKLAQARYGEIREGSAVTIYVTEPFLKNKQVKADGNNADNIPVLKLNSTKKYLTGIYPYSIMSSSFYPVADNQHAIKVSFSAQEWCGHSYTQLNNKETFDITSHSYFESDGDKNQKIEKTVLENELWNKIRINPANLPVGNLDIIPSMEFIRLSHKPLKAYSAQASLKTEGELNTYIITYPDLNRTLAIQFSATFPYTIEGWTDTFKDGYGQNAKVLKSTATKIKTINTPYWSQNSNSDLYLRDSLGL